MTGVSNSPLYKLQLRRKNGQTKQTAKRRLKMDRTAIGVEAVITKEKANEMRKPVIRVMRSKVMIQPGGEGVKKE